MRDPVREALYGSLRQRDHSPQRVIPSRELRRIKISGGLVARAPNTPGMRGDAHVASVSRMKSLFDAPRLGIRAEETIAAWSWDFNFKEK